MSESAADRRPEHTGGYEAGPGPIGPPPKGPAPGARENKPDHSLTLMCPCCSSLFEVADVHAALQALHLAKFCPETEGVLHG